MPCMLRSAVLLLALTLPVEAGDGRDVFMGVLQGLAGELDRQNARQQHDANALLQACFQGSEPGCDVALKQAWLSPSARRAVRNQRDNLAAQRGAQQRARGLFLQHWNACRDQGEAKSCDAALSYRGLNAGDRQVLLGWRHDIVRRAQEQQRQVREAAQAAERQRKAEAEAAASIAARSATADVPITTGSLAAASQPARPPIPRPVELFSVLLLIGACAAALSWLARSWPAISVRPSRAADFATHSFEHQAQSDLPLTGHFPTDVRRALAC